MKKVLLVLFVLAGLLFCYAIYIDNSILRVILKPIPLIVLLLLLKTNLKYNKLIFFGFIFSLLGDIFLMNSINMFFFGLASFLIAHVFYIIAFCKRKTKLHLVSSIPFYFVASILVFLFYPFLENIKVLVIIYMFVITTMVWRAFLQRNYDNVAIYAFFGAVLFAISDTNIALTKFVKDYNYSKIVTMFLYWSAQFLIYKSTNKTL